MRAAIVHAFNEPLEIESVDMDDPIEHEVLVRVAATGVCHSDVTVRAGQYPAKLPLILGHEGAGIVEAVGPGVTYVQPGDHVISSPKPFCGACAYCLSGRMQLCQLATRDREPGLPHRITLGGGYVGQFTGLGTFAERMLVHESQIAKVPKELPFDVAALLGCGAVTGMGAVLRTAQVEIGETVAVIGCGGVGLSAVQGARLAAAGRVIAVDRVPEKLEQARRFGATDVVNAAETDPVEAVRELTDGGVDVAVECVGRATLIEQAWAMTGRGGRVVVVGFTEAGVTISLPTQEIVFAEKRLLGTNLGSTRTRIDLPMYANLYLQGRLELDAMVSQRIRLEDVDSALDLLEGEATSVARSVVILDESLLLAT